MFADDVESIFDPAKVPGSSVYSASNGTDLGMQAIFASSFFLLTILLFSILRLRWPFIFSPRTRLTITAPPFLSRRFFGWFLATMRTSETHMLNTLGLDVVVFLRFYKMCTRLLLDISFFSIVVMWPINIRWSKVNLGPQGPDSEGPFALTSKVTDYLFNLTLNPRDPKQKWNLVPHIVFVYVFSGLAYYHISKFSSRWASLRWHFLMQSRHARVSRTVMLTGVPRHLAKSSRELEWFWGEGIRLGPVEQVRVCPFNTRLTSAARERSRCLVELEHMLVRLLGNPCVHPEYDPGRLRKLALDASEEARNEERRLLSEWARAPRPRAWVRCGWRWARVDAIDYWRDRFLSADGDLQQLRRGLQSPCESTTAFVTFRDAATAHMATQLSCYPNPGYMKAKLAPEPRAVYWPNIWISQRRKHLGFLMKWLCIFVIWAFWSVPVILMSSLLTPASLAKIFPTLSSDYLRSFLSSTVPSVFLLLFLNMLPWILKQVHFATGERTKPDIDYSVMTKMWAFLMFNIILVFGFSGTFWNMILNAINSPGTLMQNLASSIPRVGTFFTGYILVLGVGYQPFKLLQLRPVIWHIGRQWLCSTPRDYARLVAPVYIDWYSVYPYPLLVFAIAMVYSTFSPPVVVGAVIYFAIGYPVMKYLLLYVYFRPFETAGMAWPKVCRRMILAVLLYQVVILTFVIVKGGGWYTFGLVPIIMLFLWFFYHVGWSLEKQGTTLPVYLWRNPPPNSSYPMPPAEKHALFDGSVAPVEDNPTGKSVRGNGSPVRPSSGRVGKRGRGRSYRANGPAKHSCGVGRIGARQAGGLVAGKRSSSVANNTANIILGSRHISNTRGSPRKPRTLDSTRHKRYKSLAEAATFEGSRLIKSLSRIPTAYCSRSGSKRNSACEQGTKRWSFGLHAGQSARDGRVDSVVNESLEAISAEHTSQSMDGSIESMASGSNAPNEDAGGADEWSDVDEKDSPMPFATQAEWNPLMYLKPVGTQKHLAGKTLGSLLTNVEAKHEATADTLKRQSVFASGVNRACLRRRHTRSDSAVSPRCSTEGIVADTLPGAKSSGLWIRDTMHQVRDYFLADFRPAGPILDLTYDQMYSQGADTLGNSVNDDGDTVPPFRQLLGHILPRSLSRTFSPSVQSPVADISPINVRAIGVTSPLRSSSPSEGGTMDSLAEKADANASQLVRRRLNLHTRLAASPAVPTRLSPLSPGRRAEPTLSQILNREHTAPSTVPAIGPWHVGSQDGSLGTPVNAYLNGLPAPHAPWMATEPEHTAVLQHLRANSQPIGRDLHSIVSGMPCDQKSIHKNSLPPPRAPLSARVVSELNYTRATTNNDELLANYQRYAVEAQSMFAPDDHTDYSQTPMLNFNGILDRGIQDYVHPGLVGELPVLWLPAKPSEPSEQCSVEDIQTSVEHTQTPVDARRLLWLAAPHKLFKWRFKPAGGEAAETAEYYYARDLSATDMHREGGDLALQEVRVHCAESN